MSTESTLWVRLWSINPTSISFISKRYLIMVIKRFSVNLLILIIDQSERLSLFKYIPPNSLTTIFFQIGF